jgi:hypothetical protein
LAPSGNGILTTAVIIAVRPWNSLEKNVIPGTPENISLLPPPVTCF